jgi:hypothetical protein
VVSGLEASTTFSLNCQGVGGSAVAMTAVNTLGEVSINWVAPSENVDGTPLVDLRSYRIYYGLVSRSYSDSIDVVDPAATSHAFTVPSGDYYITMTALDADGNESAYANEILRTVP